MADVPGVRAQGGAAAKEAGRNVESLPTTQPQNREAAGTPWCRDRDDGGGFESRHLRSQAVARERGAASYAAASSFLFLKWLVRCCWPIWSTLNTVQ